MTVLGSDGQSLFVLDGCLLPPLPPPFPLPFWSMHVLVLVHLLTKSCTVSFATPGTPRRRHRQRVRFEVAEASLGAARKETNRWTSDFSVPAAVVLSSVDEYF